MIPEAKENHYDLLLSNFAVGLIGWIATSSGIVYFVDDFKGHYYQPGIIAVLHTFTLLTISPCILGVLYQLLPVVVEGKLGSRLLAWITSILWWIGATGFVLSRLMEPGLMPGFAGLLFLAILGLIAQLIWTTGKGHWNSSAIQVLIGSVWLLLMALSGMLMASGYYFHVPALSFIQWHAWTGILGWFSLMILALGTRLVPMFILSHGMNERWARYSGVLLMVSPLLLLPGAISGWAANAALGSALILAGYGGFLVFLFQCVRKRMRRRLEAPMILFLGSFAFPLIAALFLGIGIFDSGSLTATIQPYRFAFASVMVILLGFIGSATLGMGFKILPFMSWMALQSGARGKQVPLPQNIGISWIASVILWIYPLSVLVLVLGIFWSDAMIAGVLALLLTVGFYFTYFIHLVLFVLRRRSV